MTITGAPASPSLSSSKVARSASRPPARERGPWLRRVGELNVIKVAGSPYEMGRQHGSMLKQAIASGVAGPAIVDETLLGMKRAGADRIITYFTPAVLTREGGPSQRSARSAARSPCRQRESARPRLR